MALLFPRQKRRSAYASVIGCPAPPDDLSAWIGAVTTAGGSVSSGRQTIIGNAMASLKAQSASMGGTLWSNLDFLFVHGGEDIYQGLISIVHPAQRQANNQGATFTANIGFTGDGSSTYVDLGYKPSSDGSAFTLNSASFGLFLHSWSGTSEFEQGGAVDASGDKTTVGVTASGTGGVSTSINGNGGFTDAFGPTPGAGFYVGTRTGAGSGTTSVYRNGDIGTPFGGGGDAIGLTNRNFWIGGFNGNGVLTNAVTSTIALSFAGAGFDATDMANLNTIVQSLASAIGF